MDMLIIKMGGHLSVSFELQCIFHPFCFAPSDWFLHNCLHVQQKKHHFLLLDQLV